MVVQTLFIFVGEKDDQYSLVDFDRVIVFLSRWVQGLLSAHDPHFPTYPVTTATDVPQAIMHTVDEFVQYLGTDDEDFSYKCKGNKFKKQYIKMTSRQTTGHDTSERNNTSKYL